MAILWCVVGLYAVSSLLILGIWLDARRQGTSIQSFVAAQRQGVRQLPYKSPTDRKAPSSDAPDASAEGAVPTQIHSKAA